MPVLPSSDALSAMPASITVTSVYERLLAEILAGRREPGSTIRDQEIAQELGVSRTPVREAIQMLRSIGVVEVLPSRFTRVAVLSMHDVQRAGTAIVVLYDLLVQDIAAAGRPVTTDELELVLGAAETAIGDTEEFFAHCFRLHDLVVQLSDNLHLRRAIDAIDHALHLALLTNADDVDRRVILDGIWTIVDGLRRAGAASDPAGARRPAGIEEELPLASGE